MTKQKILKSGISYRLLDDFTIIEGLPIQNYSFEYDSFGNISLEDIAEPILPSKIYDTDLDLRKLIIKSYENNDTNTGVLLIGDKGTGKSVTAKLLCKEVNIPVIHITKPTPLGIDFVSFINKIQQEVVIFIDEFEKNFEDYDRDEMKYHTQKSFLSLMDGNSGSQKRLFIFTSNSEINNYMNDRPSRIKFKKIYKGIEHSLVEQIIKDNLTDREIIEDLIDNVDPKTFTIDALMSIIKEIKIHNIKYSKFKDIFNFNPDKKEYVISIIKGNLLTEVYSGYFDYSHYLGKSNISGLFSNISEIRDSHANFVLKSKKSDNSFIYQNEETKVLYEIKLKVERYAMVY